jgi:hypothetical protein
MTLWIVTIAALVIAVVAFVQARRTARQLAQITEMYWQLKFDHGASMRPFGADHVFDSREPTPQSPT